MAYTYYVDDGGDGSQTNAANGSWATADTNLADADTTITFANGDIVYFGHNSTDPKTYSAHTTFTMAADGACALISATQGSSPATYEAGTTYQIDTSDGAYNAIFDGGVSMYGLKIRAGLDVRFMVESDELVSVNDCTFRLGANGQMYLVVTHGGVRFNNLHIDLTDDGTTSRGSTPLKFSTACNLEIQGLTFTNPGYRTDTIFGGDNNGNILTVSGADFSGFGSGCEIISNNQMVKCSISNCLTAATWTPVDGTVRSGTEIMLANVGPADAPTYIYHTTFPGACVSSSSIYRTGGATVETEAIAWLVTTIANCSEFAPYRTPWIYGEVSSTGSKTFDLYITNDTADFTDGQVWLEVEYLGTSDEAQTAISNDHRTITTTATSQTDDTTSTWNGSGPSFTYKQKLSVTATVNETGIYRARVYVGLASIASSRYFYIDPKITVS